MDGAGVDVTVTGDLETDEEQLPDETSPLAFYMKCLPG
jgi:hypothetical protein